MNMSSNARRKGSPDTRSSIKGVTTFRNAKTRVFVFLTLVILTAVFSANALTANATAATTDTAVSQDSGFIASSFNNILSYLGLSGTKSAAIGCDDAPEGLLACYRADFESSDAKGARNGEWVGDAKYSAGKVGSGAFDFTEPNHIVVADSADLNPANITVDGWVNLADVDARGIFDVVSKGDAYLVQIIGQRVRFTSRNAKGESEILESGDFVKANTWTYLAVTHDGAEKRIYLDGYEVARGTQEGLQTTDTGVFSLGTRGVRARTDDTDVQSSSRFVDEVKLFGRALSSGEIKDVFSAGGPNAPSTASIAFTVGAQTISESGGNINLTITRGTVGAPATVDLDFLVAGTATRGIGSSCSNPNPPGTDDFLPPTVTGVQTVMFAAAEASKTIGILICSDTVAEPSETFTATLSNPTGADTLGGGPATHVVTIVDDDTTVGVTVSAATSLEDSGPNLVYTWTRNSIGAGALTVNFVSSGTAFRQGTSCPSTEDFSANSGVVPGSWFVGAPGGAGNIEFPAGSLTTTITVDPCTDTVVELDETVIVTMAAGTGYVVGTPTVASATIVNDDFPTVSVAVAPLTTTEDGAGNLVYTFTRSSAVLGAVTVNFSVAGSATQADADYAASPGAGATAATVGAATGSVTFAAASLTAEVIVNPTADIKVEADETVTFTIVAGPPMTYVVGAPAAATGTILDDDEDITVSVAPTSSLEDTGPNMVYTFNRVALGSAATTDPLTVNFSVGGTAVFTQPDYTQTGAATFTNTAGTIAFAANVTTGAVNIDPSLDTVPENSETVILTVTAGSGGNVYGIGNPNPNAVNSTATGTITNDDFQVIVTGANPAQTLEDGATNLVYTFTRIGASAPVIVANFNTSGSANPVTGPDFALLGATTYTPAAIGNSIGTVSIPVGQGPGPLIGGVETNQTLVSADPTADAVVELDENVLVQVDTGVGYTPGNPAQANGVILNDDAEVSVAVSPTAVDEDGLANLVYTFTRTGGCGSALTVNYTTSGTAVAGDFTGTNVGANTVIFPAGQCTTSVTVDPTADAMVEVDETVTLTITAATGPPNQYTIGTPAAATGTITNDDTGVSVAVAPASVTEDGAGVLTYTFTRAGAGIANALTVNYTLSGSATLTNGDFVNPPTLGPNTVAFAPGAPTATVVIDPVADLVVEADETATITITNGSGYTIGAPAAATGTITNDDTDITCTGPVPASVNENSGTAMIYSCTRVGVTATAAAIPFGLSGSATFTTDYTVAGNTSGVTAAGGTLNFAAGVATATVNAIPVADVIVESDETVIVTFTTGAGFNIVPVSPTVLTGTITNDDTDVSVTVAPASVTENGAVNLVYTFTRTTSPALLALPLTVNFSTMGTATAGTDFTQTSTGSITFAAGSATATLTVDPTGDTVVEPDETVIITITPGTGYTAVAPTSATGTISNDDTAYRIVANSPTTEGNGPAPTTATFTIFRDGANSLAGSVDVSTIPGSGTAIAGPQNTVCLAGQDYTTDGQTIMFAAGGDTSQTFTINICGDLVFELTETFDAQLTNPLGGGLITTQVATMTILDNDAAPTLSINDQPTINENAGTATFTVTQSLATGLNTTVSFATGAVGDTATAGQDYTASMGTVTIPAGSTTGTLTVPITDDTIDEPNETFTVTLSMPVNATISDGIGIGTIIDNESSTTFAIGDVSQAEGNDSANPGIPTTSSFNFQLLRTGDAQGTETVCFATEDGDGSIPGPGPNPATGALVFAAGVDYQSRPANAANCVNFTQGGPSAITIPVIVFGDNNFEFDESFTVRLLTINTVAGGARFTDATGLGTILNDDLASVFSIAQTTANPIIEGNSGTTLVTYTVTRTTTAVQSTVQYATANGATNPATGSAAGSGCGTLNSGPDYVNTSGTLTFPIGTASLTFTVAVCGDTADELNETYTATLSNATFATIGTASVTTTITDDDAAPIISVSDVTVCEVDTGTQAMVFTVTRTGLSNLTSTVTVSTVNGSAVAPGDYVAISGLVVTFNPGETTKTVTVTINGDVIFETDETFTLQVIANSSDVVSDPPNGGDPIGLGIIQNNCVGGDPAPTFAIDNVIRPEGNVDPLNPGATTPFSFRITRTGATELPSNVSFATVDPLNQAVGGAACTAGVDYITQTGTVSFTAAGLNFRDVVIQVCPDANFEQNETFFVDISNATNGTIPAIGARGTGTIQNDDGLNFTVDHVTGNEGNNPGATTSFVFRINKNGTTALSATVAYATVASATNPATGGAACGAGIDYVSTSGTATFAAATTFVDITVPVCGDVVGELDEQFLFRISAPSLGTVQASDGIGTILNDDGPVITPTGIEGDVVDAAGGPAGDNAVLANDVTAIRQMVLGNLALPGAGAQFQRTDVNIPCGNGAIDAGDVTVIRNFALGNPTPPAVCGPTAPVGTIEMSRGFGPDSPEVVGRIIRAIGSMTSAGQTVVVPIELNSQGDETSASYTVNFNSSVLTFVSAALGPGVPAGADIGTNTSQAAMGRVGVLVSSTNTYAAGPRQMALLTFTVAAGCNGRNLSGHVLEHSDGAIRREYNGCGTANYLRVWQHRHRPNRRWRQNQWSCDIGWWPGSA